MTTLIRATSIVGLTFAATTSLPGQGTRLLRHPTVSRESVAFEYAGDLWVAPRSGGTARRLTATPGVETDPYFSPDGSQHRLHGDRRRATRTCTSSPTAGGDPTRLTFHPAVDRVRGWSPDGTARDLRLESRERAAQLVSAGCGALRPTADSRSRCRCRAPSAARTRPTASASPMRNSPRVRSRLVREQRHGGTTAAAARIPIRVMNLADYSVEKLPWTDSNDSDPMWVGNTVYFLSDRNRHDQPLLVRRRHEASSRSSPITTTSTS